MSGSIQEKVQAQYGRQAAHYSTSKSHATGDSLRTLLNLASPRPTDTVLDVATGTGFCAFAFAPHAANVTAYDLTPAMLNEARKLAAERGLSNLTFQQGPAESMPFPDGTFNIVTCRVAPHHFASVPQFVAECFRVLAPGGIIAIADTAAPDDPEIDAWQNEAELLRDPSHVRNYNRQEWTGFLAGAGFQDVHAEFESWSSLTFKDWVIRSGTPEAKVTRLRSMFASATPKLIETLNIKTIADEEFSWDWPVICIKGVKTGKDR